MNTGTRRRLAALEEKVQKNDPIAYDHYYKKGRRVGDQQRLELMQRDTTIAVSIRKDIYATLLSLQLSSK